jgi:predicted DNA-binding protein (MmcQ/YjbR family)
MNIEQLREFCLSFPHATEGVKWEQDLCFLIGEKMFCICGLEPSEDWQFTFKCTPEKFAELVELDGIIPAPYVARYHWVAVQKPDVIDDKELKDLITKSYSMVLEKLPKKTRDKLL